MLMQLIEKANDKTTVDLKRATIVCGGGDAGLRPILELFEE